MILYTKKIQNPLASESEFLQIKKKKENSTTLMHATTPPGLLYLHNLLRRATRPKVQ